MQGELQSIPSLLDLQFAYDQLLHKHPASANEKDLAKYALWSRFDPRIGEIWVDYLATHWARLSPMLLREAILAQPWPAVVGVLLEFVPQLLKKESKLFTHWRKLVTFGIPIGRGELFFLGLRKIAGEMMQEDASYSGIEYRKWGYLARENLASKKGQTHFSKETRMALLRKLLLEKKRIRISDYRKIVGGGLSTRQLERDLTESGLVRSYGNTRGKIYLRR